MPRSGIMLCYPFEEKRLLKWRTPYLVQPKLDGVRCRAVPNQDGKYTLLSSEEKEIISTPHINKELNALGTWMGELDGELYCHGMPFEEIFSRTGRTVNLHPDYKDIKFHIFDRIENKEQINRLFDFHFKSENPLVRVETQLAYTLEDVMRIYDSLISKGYEGIIVRHLTAPYVRRRSQFIMKFKPKKDDYYKIIGYKEEMSIHGEPKGRLGALTCISDLGESFSVGSGLTENNRNDLWTNRERIIGRLAHVKYQHITSGKGVPRFPIFIEIIEVEPKEIGIRND